MNPLTIGVDSRKLKRIAVTCKCGNRFVATIPGEVLDGGAAPVLKCETCQQEYIISAGKLRRLEHGMLGKLVDKQQLPAPADVELTDGVDLPDEKSWEMPQSKLVN